MEQIYGLPTTTGRGFCLRKQSSDSLCFLHPFNSNAQGGHAHGEFLFAANGDDLRVTKSRDC